MPNASAFRMPVEKSARRTGGPPGDCTQWALELDSAGAWLLARRAGETSGSERYTSPHVDAQVNGAAKRSSEVPTAHTYGSAHGCLPVIQL